jgi:flagella basal body P-ring formation protein FlgA
MRCTSLRTTFRVSVALGLALTARGGLLAETIPVIEVERERVTAADLAQILPEWGRLPGTVEILYAPLPGLTREFPRAEMERLATRHGLTGAVWPERVRLRRRERLLERAEAESALAAAIAERYKAPPENVGLELARYAPARVPAGPLAFRTGMVRLSSQMTTIPLTWSTPERRSGTLWLRARVTLRGTYAVAARTLEAGVVVQPADVTFVEGNLPGPPEQWDLRPEDLPGRALARPVEAGGKISRLWLREAPPDVKAGARLELRLESGPIQLRVPGRAEQEGRAGEQIAVRNLQSNRRVIARLVHSGLAEVVTGEETTR